VRIAIASDEQGNEIRERLATALIAAGHELADKASVSADSGPSDYSEQVALAVLRHDAERGIIITSRAVGASVAANRVPGIRAALCGDAHSAHVGAKEEGMNVMVLPLPLLREDQIREIVKAYLGATLAAVDVVGGLPPRRLQRIFSHVRENISLELSVIELAQVAGMSQYYFSKLFKMSTGTTPHQYVMRQRVERAQEYLRETKVGLADVAMKVGFETQSHFTSVFRRLAGITPKHYREMHRVSQHDRDQFDLAKSQKAATAA
jgi:RpiB/LacA/LacB family sugar-phosphate isomerase